MKPLGKTENFWPEPSRPINKVLVNEEADTSPWVGEEGATSTIIPSGAQRKWPAPQSPHLDNTSVLLGHALGVAGLGMLGEQCVVSLGPSGSDNKDLGAVPSELPELPHGGHSGFL